MILTGKIIESDVKRTNYPRREFWRVVILPISRGKQDNEPKYVNFHEPNSMKIRPYDYKPLDIVTIKCFERKGLSGKKFIHGVRIMKLPKRKVVLW